MSVVHRALAALPVAALAMAVPSAHAAPAVQTLPCVPYVENSVTHVPLKTMPISVAGFAPGGFVEINTASAASPTPRILTSFRLDGIGGFAEANVPPPFTKGDKGNLETFNVFATDKITNPAAPLVATASFQVVRFGLTRVFASKQNQKPTSRVTVTARGFSPGKPIYAHFSFGGRTDPAETKWARKKSQRTVGIGIAAGPCGIAEKKMRALPTKTRYGVWRAYIDQTKKFSYTSRPQWIDSFRVYRTFG